MATTKLSTFIRQNNAPILCEWETFARSLVHDSSLDVVALRDHAEALLDEIADDIDAPQSDCERSDRARGLRQDGRRSGPAAMAAAEHGHERAGNGFTFMEMIAEFRALRASVTRLWVAQSSQFGRAELEGLIRFNEAIDEAVAYSLERYARDIDETRQRFLAILSHDLRNPLAAVAAAAGFLRELDELDEDHARLVVMIQSAASRMTHLVSDMLELALNRFGDRMPIHRSEVDVGHLVDDVVAEVRASHSAAQIDVCSEGDLIGQWDGDRLAQALTNLIANAVQHGDLHAPIQVSARGGAEDVAIEVRNSGPPIPRDRLRRIFDGTRLGGRLDDDRRHLGLGLFIVNKIVEGHGGSIDVKSADAETAFTIHLPRAA